VSPIQLFLQKIACQNFTFMKKILLNMDVRIIVNVMELEFVHQVVFVKESLEKNLPLLLLNSNAQWLLV
jgi:hypothetical protein